MYDEGFSGIFLVQSSLGGHWHSKAREYQVFPLFSYKVTSEGESKMFGDVVDQLVLF
jgi:hypothetical protein